MDTDMTTVIEIFVKTLTGDEVPLKCESNIHVEILKEMVFKKCGIPVDQQHFIYAGRQLEDGVTLDKYGIGNKSTIHLVLRLRGGGVFVDVTQGHMKQQIFTSGAPEWRRVSPGLILLAECTNPMCEAGGDAIAINKEMCESFDIINASAQCPMCHSDVLVENCGFVMCQWKYSGQLADGTIKESEWKVCEINGMEYFDTKKNGMADWHHLSFTTKKVESDKKTLDRIMYGLKQMTSEEQEKFKAKVMESYKTTGCTPEEMSELLDTLMK